MCCFCPGVITVDSTMDKKRFFGTKLGHNILTVIMTDYYSYRERHQDID